MVRIGEDATRAEIESVFERENWVVFEVAGITKGAARARIRAAAGERPVFTSVYSTDRPGGGGVRVLARGEL